MSRVYLELVNGSWEEVPNSEFWIDRFLYNKLLSIKRIQNKEWDGVIVIDGKERSGKSVLGMTCGWFLSNGTITEKNFASGLEDASRKIAELPDKSILIMDEGSLLFSSKSSTGKEQKRLVQILDVVGQKNLIFIICLPCFFDLNKTIAVRRSLFLLHVYPDAEYNRGRYAFWGDSSKGKLYRIGKKNYDSYAYPSASFVGLFFPFKPPFYEKYLNQVKKDSLDQVLASAMGQLTPDDRLKAQKKEIIAKLYIPKQKLTYQFIADTLGMDISTIFEWIKEYKRQISKNP